jgi:hypothetical protein
MRDRRAVERRRRNPLIRSLGWFSIALGVAELAAPQGLGGALGRGDKAGLIEAYGLREIAAGLGILAAEPVEPWLWARVAGDVLDLATLLQGFGRRPMRPGNLLGAILAVSAVTAIDVCVARQARLAARARNSRYL